MRVQASQNGRVENLLQTVRDFDRPEIASRLLLAFVRREGGHRILTVDERFIVEALRFLQPNVVRSVDGGQHLRVAHLNVRRTVGLLKHAELAVKLANFARFATVHSEALVVEQLDSAGHLEAPGVLEVTQRSNDRFGCGLLTVELCDL